jgi:hypothetical protein
MKYEYSEAAATFAMLGAIVSVGLWILQLTYSVLYTMDGCLCWAASFISSTVLSPTISKG